MFTTTEDNLANHLIRDMGIQPDDLVFMFSGLMGLGRLEKGLETIESAIDRVIPDGVLIIPTFSYSWSEGQVFDKATSCPEMGSFSNFILGLENYKRTSNPNFSVAIRSNSKNTDLVDHFLDIGTDCFGHGSIFEKVFTYSKKRRAWILLLGGAFNDVKYRSTFIHFAQQKIGVPHRYLKRFKSPDGANKEVTQLVRFLSEDEFRQHSTFMGDVNFKFPVEEDYSAYGEDLDREEILIQKPFGYYPSRMVSVRKSVDFYINKIQTNPLYCIADSSII